MGALSPNDTWPLINWPSCLGSDVWCRGIRKSVLLGGPCLRSSWKSPLERAWSKRIFFGGEKAKELEDPGGPFLPASKVEEILKGGDTPSAIMQSLEDVDRQKAQETSGRVARQEDW